ncbi:MAG TPA: Gfo/Idh/MocA family oxidoreductase, partial [Opitutales bacterium]|nr:Gfo/Idh/MocA family oxidoreductase [Opitutales bacterium]
MKKKFTMTRRQALKSLGGLASIQIVPRHVLGGPGHTAPSEVLTKGIIGCGTISHQHLTMPGKLLALCDVDAKHLEGQMAKAASRGDTDVTGYHDYRELIARKDIDIVHVATPPHWHALMAIDAAKAGKDIWCEKPMSRTIGEGVAMVKAVHEENRIFRINTWFRFRGGFYGMGMPVAPIKQAVQAGMFGWPLTVTVGAKTGFGWKLGMWTGRTDLSPQPIPEHFDYDFWLGPAPDKPYHPHRTHDTFRGYWDYDGGGLGDMGQHYLDPVQFILGKDDESPVSVEVDADPQHFDAVGVWRRITLTYADGCRIVLDGENKEENAKYIQGPKGWMGRRFESNIPDLRKKVSQLPPLEPVVTDFHEAVRTRKKFALNEDNGFRST